MAIPESDAFWFEVMATEETGLSRLLAEARTVQDRGALPYFCASEYMRGNGLGLGPYFDFRKRLAFLVGPHRNGDDMFAPADAPDAHLYEQHAFDVAERVIRGALPPCRACWGCERGSLYAAQLRVGSC